MKSAYKVFLYRDKRAVCDFIDSVASRLITVSTVRPEKIPIVIVWYWEDNSEAADNVTEELTGTEVVMADEEYRAVTDEAKEACNV